MSCRLAGVINIIAIGGRSAAVVDDTSGELLHSVSKVLIPSLASQRGHSQFERHSSASTSQRLHCSRQLRKANYSVTMQRSGVADAVADAADGRPQRDYYLNCFGWSWLRERSAGVVGVPTDSSVKVPAPQRPPSKSPQSVASRPDARRLTFSGRISAFDLALRR